MMKTINCVRNQKRFTVKKKYAVICKPNGGKMVFSKENNMSLKESTHQGTCDQSMRAAGGKYLEMRLQRNQETSRTGFEVLLTILRVMTLLS